ncbi:MAG: MFS transporter, partial [Pollutimonas bauzanensis]
SFAPSIRVNAIGPGPVLQSTHQTPEEFAREAARSDPRRPLGLTPSALQGLLCIAGVACCVAMAMPQVHIVAYCGDLGFG